MENGSNYDSFSSIHTTTIQIKAVIKNLGLRALSWINVFLSETHRTTSLNLSFYGNAGNYTWSNYQLGSWVNPSNQSSLKISQTSQNNEFIHECEIFTKVDNDGWWKYHGSTKITTKVVFFTYLSSLVTSNTPKPDQTMYKNIIINI